MEEFKHLGYAFDKDLEVINADAGNTLLREWIESEYKFRVKLESKKLVQDELIYFESLSLQAKANGNLELCKRWEAVIAKEKEEQLCDYELILAWSLERAGKKENYADQIWRLASSFHQDFPYSFTLQNITLSC
jgi:hypothetical protein